MSRSRVTAVGVVVLCTAALSVAGWKWMDGLVVSRVVVHGNHHAGDAAILDVARVDTGVRLLDVRPAVIADRTERHPWVLAANVRRLPPDLLIISVDERSPVALALSDDGRPTAYLDPEGYAMPPVEGAVYDVPLLRGARLPENRTQPLESSSLIELLASIGRLDATVDALISSFEVDADGEVTLHTAPAGSQGSIEVRLGALGYTDKLERLRAFWNQAVLSRPGTTFETIDLRFDGQIVTQES